MAGLDLQELATNVEDIVRTCPNMSELGYDRWGRLLKSGAF